MKRLFHMVFNISVEKGRGRKRRAVDSAHGMLTERSSGVLPASGFFDPFETGVLE